VPIITIPSGTVIGRMVDAKIGAAPGRVTLLSEGACGSSRTTSVLRRSFDRSGASGRGKYHERKRHR
jgi:hypothetical protein